jgi:hypothetical protein
VLSLIAGRPLAIALKNLAGIISGELKWDTLRHDPRFKKNCCLTRADGMMQTFAAVNASSHSAPFKVKKISRPGR